MHDRINRRISKSEDVLSGLEAWRILPEAEKRQKAMEGIDRKIREKRIMYSPSPVRLFLIQLQYIPFAFWLSQGSVLVSVVFLLCRTTLQQGGVMDYLWWGSVAAAWMGLMACGGLNRHLARGMVELEQSCYINMLQLWTMRMILSGCMDMAILCVCSGVAAWNTRVRLVRILLYLLVPFVLSNACYLIFLTSARGRRTQYPQIIIGAVSGVMAMTPRLFTGIYSPDCLWVWLILLTGGVYLWVERLRCCRRKIARGEMLCWN